MCVCERERLCVNVCVHVRTHVFLSGCVCVCVVTHLYDVFFSWGCICVHTCVAFVCGCGCVVTSVRGCGWVGLGCGCFTCVSCLHMHFLLLLNLAQLITLPCSHHYFLFAFCAYSKRHIGNVAIQKIEDSHQRHCWSRFFFL